MAISKKTYRAAVDFWLDGVAVKAGENVAVQSTDVDVLLASQQIEPVPEPVAEPPKKAAKKQA